MTIIKLMQRREKDIYKIWKSWKSYFSPIVDAYYKYLSIKKIQHCLVLVFIQLMTTWEIPLCSISNIHRSIKLSTNLGQQDDPLAVWPDDVIHLWSHLLPRQVRSTQRALDKAWHHSYRKEAIKLYKQNKWDRIELLGGVSFLHPLIHDKNIQKVLEGEILDFYLFIQACFFSLFLVV